MMHKKLTVQVLADTRYWFPLLSTWQQANNKEDSRAGWRAMDAFVDTVAIALIQNPAKEQKKLEVPVKQEEALANKEVPAPLAFLAEQFKAILLTTNSSSKSMGLAIQGYGKLAPALVRHYPLPECVRMVGEVLYRAEQVYLQAGKKEESWLLQLPGHVLACAGLISSLPSHSPTILSTLERLAVLLLDRFPHLPSQYHFRYGYFFLEIISRLKIFRAVKAIQATLEAAGQQEREDVQESLVEQALLRSCSHPALVAGSSFFTLRLFNSLRQRVNLF